MNWFCIYSAIAGEFRALRKLEQRGLQCYLPLLTSQRRIGGRVVSRRAPLLARYLFVLTDLDRLSAIRELTEIQEILPHEMMPQPIAAIEISSLQEREQAGEFVFRNTTADRRRRRQILRSFQELGGLYAEIQV